MSAQLAVVEKSESLDPSSQPLPDLVGPEVVVLKFGSSILRSPAEAPLVASAVYGHVRAGRKVVAVVSAFGGATDRLLDACAEHDLPLLPGAATASEIRAAVSAVGGHASCYSHGLQDSPFQPLAPTLLHYHQRLKAQLDPQGIFNPGRLYAEL